MKWARFSHANKPTRWVVARYYGQFNKARQDRWVFGDRKSGAYMHHFAWTNIVRHQIVKHRASPDDPTLADYWANGGARRPCRSTRPADGSSKPRTVAARSARTALLADDDRPQTPREWETWLATTRKAITKVITPEDPAPDEHEPRLVHVRCRDSSGLALLPAYEPEGLA